MSRNRISKDAFSQVTTISLLTVCGRRPHPRHRRAHKGVIESPRWLVEAVVASAARSIPVSDAQYPGQ